MFYKVELVCHHPPHQCRCRHNVATEVDRDDLTSNLIKYNPALLKYLGRTTTTVQSPPQQEDQQPLRPAEQPYRSIVQEKGLKYILRDNFVSQSNTLPKQPTSPKGQGPSQTHQQIKPPAEQPANTADRQPTSPKHSKPVPESQREKEVKKFHKGLKNQSRYLSNTAFRKYFDRQCFQNYGNQNVHDKGDGFVYGNYLKTYNINPHTGHNMPNNQETFYHALVTASPEKYAQTQELHLEHTGKVQQGEKKTGEGHSLERDTINVEKMLEDNLKHSQLERKYQHLKLKPKAAIEARKDSVTMARSRDRPNITPNPNSQANYSPFSPKHQLPLQSRKHLPASSHPPTVGQTEQEIIRNHQSGVRVGSRAQSMAEVVQPSKEPVLPSSPQCQHMPGEQTSTCECCLNQMKGLILSLADSDPDLASRIVASAKKATLYKNFALNNYEQASMNPHNYANSGRLNVYHRP